jgi:hypothetical protein
MFYTNLHTVQETQMGNETVAEEIICDMLHDIVDSFVVHLQQVHKVEAKLCMKE